MPAVKVYDLHNHSTASDGELSPPELVRFAASRGVEVLALTDHDVTDGLAAAHEAAGQEGISLINGVEISVTWNKRLVHIVGLAFDPDNASLQNGLAGLRRNREGRAEEISLRLAKAGIEGAYDGARSYAGGSILSRTHFAQFLLAQGRVKSLQDAFNRYLGEGKKAYAPCQWAGLEEAVAWIRGAGGHAVVAHPARYKMTATRLRSLLGEFKECGGAALEVISGSQDPNATRQLADHAERFGLAASIGSDYHGPSQSWLKMGALPPLPSRCTPVWSLWAGD